MSVLITGGSDLTASTKRRTSSASVDQLLTGRVSQTAICPPYTDVMGSVRYRLRKSRYYIMVFGAPTLCGPRSRSSAVCFTRVPSLRT